MITIPSGVFSKYAEAADAMLALSGFGTQCKLVFANKIEVVNNVPSIKKKKTLGLQHSNSVDGFNRGETSYRTVETTEDIVLRVYWDKKTFEKYAGIDFPNGGVMTIGAYADLDNVDRASFLLINTDKTGHVEWKFEKVAESRIHGLNKNYIMSFWKRT